MSETRTSYRTSVPTDPTLTIVAGDERIVITGRMVTMIGELLRCREEVDAVPVGKVSMAFNHGHVHPLHVEKTMERD